MPVMGGRELTEYFKTACPEGKVLYMSGYFDDMVNGRGIRGTEGGFMQKPVTMIEMSLRFAPYSTASKGRFLFGHPTSSRP